MRLKPPCYIRGAYLPYSEHGGRWQHSCLNDAPVGVQWHGSAGLIVRGCLLSFASAKPKEEWWARRAALL
jgi:hypothetical protein